MTTGIGILGFAHGHVGTYAARWQQRPDLGARVVAGWDHDPARATANCQKLGAACCASVDELLSRPDVQGLVIGAETSLHADLVEQAAPAGKPIVLQKPIALTLDQADRIVAAVQRTGVPFSLAWQMRVDPHNLKMKELLAGGRFGKLFMVRRRHCLSTHLWPDFAKTWHVQPALNRDIFADDAPHAIDFLYWLLGRPASVTAELGSLLNPAVPNDNAIVIFRYPDGSFGEVSSTFCAPAGENTCEIVCEKGVIIGNFGDQPSSAAPRPPGAIQLKWLLHGEDAWTVSDLPDLKNQGERIANLAGPLAAFLRGERPPIATAEEGRDVLTLTEACYTSATQGRRVPVRY